MGRFDWDIRCEVVEIDGILELYYLIDNSILVYIHS